MSQRLAEILDHTILRQYDIVIYDENRVCL